MKAAVIIFPGSNCDRDVITTLEKVTGNKPDTVWHADSQLLAGVDLVVLPGGFSYGDYLRSGAMSARSPIMQEVVKRAKQGAYVLGICNGFQVLTESGLLPGALMRNKDLKFICKTVPLKVANNDTAFTGKYSKDSVVNIPIAHHDGNYFTAPDDVKKLEDQGQVAFYYDGCNPNGSVSNIAGVLSENKRILGMMPHPERAADGYVGGVDGAILFESLVENIG